jgi:hypothetical protein
MLALDLREAVAHGGQEIFVGADDRAVELKLNYRLGTADRLTTWMTRDMVVPYWLRDAITRLMPRAQSAATPVT